MPEMLVPSRGDHPVQIIQCPKILKLSKQSYSKPRVGVGWLKIPSGREIWAVQASGEKIHRIYQDRKPSDAPSYQEPCPGLVLAWGLPCGCLTWVLLHQKSAFCFSMLPKQRAGTPDTKPRRGRDKEGCGGGFSIRTDGLRHGGAPARGRGGARGCHQQFSLLNAPASLSNSAHGSPPSSAHSQPRQPLLPRTGILRAGKNAPGAAAWSGCLEIPGADNTMMFFGFSSPPQARWRRRHPFGKEK